MQTKKHTLFFIFFSMTVHLCCSQNRLSKQAESKFCFCDSITKGRQMDSLQEFFCFTKNYTYTLELKNKYERIRRISAKGSQFGYEELENYLNDSLKSTNSQYLKIEQTKTNYLVEFVTGYFEKSIRISVDSLSVKILQGKDTLFSNVFKGTIASLSKDLCENPKNTLVLTNYWTLRETQKIDYPEHYSDEMSERERHCDFRDEEIVTFPGPIVTPIVAPISYLIQHPLDKILPKVKECIAHGK